MVLADLSSDKTFYQRDVTRHAFGGHLRERGTRHRPKQHGLDRQEAEAQ